MIIGVLRIRPACRRSPLIRHSRLLNDVLLSDNAGAGCRFRNRSRVSGLVYPAARKGDPVAVYREALGGLHDQHRARRPVRHRVGHASQHTPAHALVADHEQVGA